MIISGCGIRLHYSLENPAANANITRSYDTDQHQHSYYAEEHTKHLYGVQPTLDRIRQVDRRNVEFHLHVVSNSQAIDIVVRCRS